MCLPEQRQAGEAERSSRDLLPEAGSLSDALRLGHGEHHGGHLDGHAGPWRPRLGQLTRRCVTAAMAGLLRVSNPPACVFPPKTSSRPLSFFFDTSGKSSSIDRRTQIPRRNSERFSTMDDQLCNFSAFKPATITISTLFKQVRLPPRDTRSAVSIKGCCPEMQGYIFYFFQDGLAWCWSACLDATIYHAFTSSERILSLLLHNACVVWIVIFHDLNITGPTLHVLIHFFTKKKF